MSEAIVAGRWQEVKAENGPDLYRLRVHGGWLVRMDYDVVHDKSQDGYGMTGGWDWRPALAFVPDERGLWT